MPRAGVARAPSPPRWSTPRCSSRAPTWRRSEPDAFATVGVDRLGRVDLDAWATAVGVPGTVAAALQHANGEVGTVQPLDDAHAACRRAGVPLAVDAQASLGRADLPTAYDVLAGDAQSWGGPGGLGVLVVPERTRWRLPGPTDPDTGLSGLTGHVPWVPLALAAAEAWQQTAAARRDDARSAAALVDEVRSAAGQVPDVEVAGDPVGRLPHVLTFSALYADGEALVREFDRRGFAVASGSACTASTLEPSHVLAAMGVLTHGNVRLTLPLAAVAPDRERAGPGLRRDRPRGGGLRARGARGAAAVSDPAPPRGPRRPRACAARCR